MISMTFQADTVELLHYDMLSAMGLPPDIVRQLMNGEPPALVGATPALAAEAPAVEPAKRGRGKARAADAAPVQEVIPPAAKPTSDNPFESPAAKTTTVEAPTLDDTRAALNKVLEAKGMDTVFDIVKAFKQADGKPAAKASQLKAEDYAAVIAACEAVV